MVTEVGMALSYRCLALVGGLLMLGFSGVWLGLTGSPTLITYVRLHAWFLTTLVVLVLFLAVWVVPLTVDVVRTGHLRACVARARAQLRADTPAIRLAGIAAFEQIAQASPADHWAVMECLLAYVRAHAPWPPHAAQPLPAESSPEARHRAEESFSEVPSTAEIQAVLGVLGRRTRAYETEEQWLNLRQVDLRGMNLQEIHLEGADLRSAHLEGADLKNAYLAGALLSAAHLEGADLQGSHLEGAYVGDANLEGAVLRAAHLERAALRRAHLARTDLTGAHLEGADLEGADLTGALLNDTHLEGADLTGAVHLTREQMAGAILDDMTRLPPSLMARSEGCWQPPSQPSHREMVM
jgi:uncharacterized protein YjbI with pentapeptide repeats